MARFDDWVTDPRRAAGRRRGIPRRSEAYRRALPRPLPHLEELGEHRRAGHLRAGRRRPRDVRRADGRASRSAALRSAIRVAARWPAADGPRWSPRPAITSPASRRGSACVKAARGSPRAASRSWIRCRSSSPTLNAYQPAFLASYPTMLALLAEERKAGRLRDRSAAPVVGRRVPVGPGARREIERAFGCRVVNEYGASECMSIAYGCDEGWLHVNADWVLLEPVDDDYRPTPPGRAVAHGAAHQPRQPRAADHPLRPGRQRDRQARAVRVRQPAAGDPGRGQARRRDCDARARRPRSCGCCRSR